MNNLQQMLTLYSYHILEISQVKSFICKCELCLLLRTW